MVTRCVVVCCSLFCTLLPMEHHHHVVAEQAYERTVTEWPSQSVVVLKKRVPGGDCSLMYCVPKVAKNTPIIGYARCVCSSGSELASNMAHRMVLINLFRAALDNLSEQGFTEVKFSLKLCESPACLAQFVSNPSNVPVVKQDGVEITTYTEYPF